MRASSRHLAPRRRSTRRRARGGSGGVLVERRGKPRAGHPPRLAGPPPRRPASAPGQQPGALEAREAAEQQLAAPDGPVARRSPCRRRSRPRPARSRRARRGRPPGARGGAARRPGATPSSSLRVLGRQVLGMQVVRHHRGLDREQPLEVVDALRERAQRLVVLEVADVMAHPRAPALRHGEGVLQLARRTRAGAAARDRQRDRRRHVAARAAQHAAGAPPPRAPPSRRCASRSGGRAAGRVGDAAEPLARFLVAIGDRLVGHVAARHHQRLAGVGQQQVVQRRVGQHHAELARARRDRAATARVRPARAPARSAARGGSSSCPRPRQLDQRARRGQVRRHQRERLVLAVLARAQLARPRPRRRRGRPDGSRRGP